MGKKSSFSSKKNRNGASSNSSSTSTSRIKAVSFGRNYFYQRGSHEDVEQTEGEEQQQQQQQQQLAKTSSQFPWKDRLPAAAVCTAQSTVVLTQQGHVYQTGTLHGRLYEGWTRIPCPLPLNCVQLSAGRHFVVARLEGGQAVVTWGAGHFGQLGVTESSRRGRGDDDDDGDDDYGGNATTTTAMMHAPEPVLVQRLLPAVTGSPIRQVAAGDWHCLALTVSGTVWCWGSNRSLQCGVKHPSNNNHHGSTLALPRPIATLPEMMQIAAGRSHSVALAKAGGSSGTGGSSSHIYAWGASQHGQCGTGICTRRGVPGLLPAAIDTLPPGLEMVQIAAAGHHTLALSRAGRVFSWGDGREGQLGLSLANNSSNSNSNNNDNAVDIAQLQTSKPRLVADLDFVAVAAGQEWKQQQQQQQQQKQEAACGNTTTTPTPTTSNNTSAAEALASIPKIVSVHAAASYSAALSSSGHVYCWGSNDVGQLGVPTPPDLPWCDGSMDLERLADNESSSNAEPQQQRPTESNARLLHARNFDSNHNVLLPVRLEGPLLDVRVSSLAMGPNHMWCFGEKRESNATVVVGRTLWEVQEEHRRKRLASIRSRLQQPKQQQQAEERGDLSLTNAVAAKGPPQLPDETKPPEKTTTSGAATTEMTAAATDATLIESELAVDESDVAPTTPSPPDGAADFTTPTTEIIEPAVSTIQDIAGAGTISPSSTAAAAAANTSGSSGSTSEEEGEESQSNSAVLEQSDSYYDVSNTSAQDDETLPVVIPAAAPTSPVAMPTASTTTRQKRPNMLRRLSKKLRRRRSSRSSGSTAEMGGGGEGGGAADGSESTSTSTRRRGLRGIQEVLASSSSKRG